MGYKKCWAHQSVQDIAFSVLYQVRDSARMYKLPFAAATLVLLSLATLVHPASIYGSDNIGGTSDKFVI